MDMARSPEQHACCNVHRRQQEELCAERQRVDAAHAVARQSMEALRGRELPGAGAGGPEAEARLAREAEQAMHQVLRPSSLPDFLTRGC